MELFLAILAFVSLIAVSHIINRVAPFIPVPIRGANRVDAVTHLLLTYGDR
ncbi:MAG: hypothetical protein ACE3L7_05320 [Candidatus Pristimantibacillus sp.]